MQTEFMTFATAYAAQNKLTASQFQALQSQVITAEVDIAIAEGRLKAEQKEAMMKLGAQDLNAMKALLGNATGVATAPAHESIATKLVANNTAATANDKNNGGGNEASKKTYASEYMRLCAEDPIALEKMQTAEPDKFNKLVSDHKTAFENLKNSRFQG